MMGQETEVDLTEHFDRKIEAIRNDPNQRVVMPGPEDLEHW